MEADIAMMGTILVIAASTILYATERYSIEAISLGILAAYVAMFGVFDLPAGSSQFGLSEILSGFSNSGLITIVALLVVGQGLFHTDALERPAHILVKWVVKHGAVGIAVTFISSGWADMVAYGFLIVTLIFFPQGLFGAGRDRV